MNEKDPVTDQAQRALDRIGAGTLESLQRLPGGKNNQVYRVTTTSGQAFALKLYFIHHTEQHDRLGHEFSFLRYAWSQGIRCIPEPLFADAESGTGLMQFVEGRGYQKGDITRADVDQAIGFLMALNSDPSAAQDLPIAREACFSLAEHLGQVDLRLERLHLQLDAGAGSAEAGADDLLKRARPVWTSIREQIDHSLSNTSEMGDEIRIISPSDFGFHNAIQRSVGIPTFLDFEYAGWDDPAKTICDFAHQPRIPVPREYLEAMYTQLESLPQGIGLRGRVELLMPVYAFKWVLILLNEFSSGDALRRMFAASSQPIEALKQRQLDKAERAFLDLKEQYLKD